jgi:hypothetical protein
MVNSLKELSLDKENKENTIYKDTKCIQTKSGELNNTNMRLKPYGFLASIDNSKVEKHSYLRETNLGK